MARREQGAYRLGVEAGVGREFMRVYESLREIDGEIGVGMGWRGWWGLGEVFLGVKAGGWGGRGAVLGGEGGCGGVLGRGRAVGGWVMGRGEQPLLMGRRLSVIFHLFQTDSRRAMARTVPDGAFLRSYLALLVACSSLRPGLVQPVCQGGR